MEGLGLGDLAGKGAGQGVVTGGAEVLPRCLHRGGDTGRDVGRTPLG